MRRPIIFVVSIWLVFTVTQAHAGLIRQAIKHPVLTGTAIVASVAIIAHADKKSCAKSSGFAGLYRKVDAICALSGGQIAWHSEVSHGDL